MPTSASLVPRGMGRQLWSLHQGSRRSSSWSKGAWSWRAIPALETSATRQWSSGLASGVQGIDWGGGSCWIQERTSLRVGPSTKACERTRLASSP